MLLNKTLSQSCLLHNQWKQYGLHCRRHWMILDNWNYLRYLSRLILVQTKLKLVATLLWRRGGGCQVTLFDHCTTLKEVIVCDPVFSWPDGGAAAAWIIGRGEWQELQHPRQHRKRLFQWKMVVISHSYWVFEISTSYQELLEKLLVKQSVFDTGGTWTRPVLVIIDHHLRENSRLDRPLRIDFTIRLLRGGLNLLSELCVNIE